MQTKSIKDHGTVAVSFKDYIKADHFYHELISRGYDTDDITIVMSQKTREMLPEGTKVTDASSVSEDAGKGAMTGGVLGGIVGAILALGTSVVFPVTGFVIAGPLLGALTAAGAGGIAGGIVGAIAHSGVDYKDAEKYAEKIATGEIVLVVDPKTANDINYFNDMSDKFETTYYTASHDESISNSTS